MFCPKCGNNNNDLNLWCIRCGCKLEKIKEDTEALDIAQSTTENEPEYAAEINATANDTNVQKSNKIKDYMTWSIISAVLGSIVFGIIAVIFSGLTKTEFAAGCIDKAGLYSDKAKLFCLISLAIAIVKVIFIILVLIIVAFVASMPLYLH